MSLDGGNSNLRVCFSWVDSVCSDFPGSTERVKNAVSLRCFWRTWHSYLHSSSTQPVPAPSSRQDTRLVYFSPLFSTFAGSWNFHTRCWRRNAGEPLGCEQPLPLFWGGHTDVLLSRTSDCSLLWDPAGKMLQTMKSINRSCGARKGTTLSISNKPRCTLKYPTLQLSINTSGFLSVTGWIAQVATKLPPCEWFLLQSEHLITERAQRRSFDSLNCIQPTVLVPSGNFKAFHFLPFSQFSYWAADCWVQHSN